MPTRHANQRTADARADTKTVLIADDDRLIVATLAQRLRGAGYAVLEAFDGATALAMCDTMRPDLAILDYSMPNLTGVEVARELARSGNVPVIFLSAYSDEAIVNDAITAGALTYVVKPIDTEQILPIVRTALLRAKELRALREQTDHLRTQLANDQTVSAAAGLLMAALKISRQEAFERLRQKARAQRVKLDVIAQEFLEQHDESSRLLQEFTAPPSPTKRPNSDPD